MKKNILLLSLIFLLITPIATAIGVSFPYYKDNPLVLRPNENQIINFTVQAPAKESDTIITASITDNPENLAEIVGKTEFTIPQGEKSVKIPVKIQIPKNAKTSEQTISVKFKQLAAEEGMVQFSPAMTVSFPLKIIESPPERKALERMPTKGELSKTTITVLITAGIASFLMLTAIIFLAIKIKRDKQNFQPSYPKYNSP